MTSVSFIDFIPCNKLNGRHTTGVCRENWRCCLGDISVKTQSSAWSRSCDACSSAARKQATPRFLRIPGTGNRPHSKVFPQGWKCEFGRRSRATRPACDTEADRTVTMATGKLQQILGLDLALCEGEQISSGSIIHKRQKSQCIHSTSSQEALEEATVLLQLVLGPTSIRNQRMWERTQKWPEWSQILLKHHRDCFYPPG